MSIDGREAIGAGVEPSGSPCRGDQEEVEGHWPLGQSRNLGMDCWPLIQGGYGGGPISNTEGVGTPIQIKREFSSGPVGGREELPPMCKAVTLGHVKPLLPTRSGVTGWGANDWGRQSGADL